MRDGVGLEISHGACGYRVLRLVSGESQAGKMQNLGTGTVDPEPQTLNPTRYAQLTHSRPSGMDMQQGLNSCGEVEEAVASIVL